MMNEADREKSKVVAAIEAGRIGFSTDAIRGIARINIPNPDMVIAESKIDSFWGKHDRSNGGIDIHWEADGVGNGRIVIAEDKDGVVRCDPQCMSRDFVKAVLCHLVDNMESEDWPKEAI